MAGRAVATTVMYVSFIKVGLYQCDNVLAGLVTVRTTWVDVLQWSRRILLAFCLSPWRVLRGNRIGNTNADELDSILVDADHDNVPKIVSPLESDQDAEDPETERILDESESGETEGTDSLQTESDKVNEQEEKKKEKEDEAAEEDKGEDDGDADGDSQPDSSPPATDENMEQHEKQNGRREDPFHGIVYIDQVIA